MCTMEGSEYGCGVSLEKRDSMQTQSLTMVCMLLRNRETTALSDSVDDSEYGCSNGLEKHETMQTLPLVVGFMLS